MRAKVINKPLIKWPGGKRLLVKEISQFIPSKYLRYIEPFSGGIALFFHVQPETAILSDINPSLINLYNVVKDNPKKLISELQNMENSEFYYYLIRSSRPKSRIKQAARFYYLMTLSFNGIYRENLKGEFNVPYGYKTHLNVCNSEDILAASKILEKAEIHNWDFETTMEFATEKDFIYCDPPYTLAHNNNGFIKYNAKLFSWDDQIRLAKKAEELRLRGCNVVVSNAFHKDVIDLYPNFNLHKINRFTQISGLSKGRSLVDEALFYSVKK